jgi:assimilatory nitrate reductase catalytic subunit
VLAGRAPGAQPDNGPLVCVCFDVGATTILRAIADQRLASVAEVGKALRAGTNCGSCRPAIAGLLTQAREPLHAA